MEETTTEASKRPQFLTVLCILTYIGVGIGIIGSIGAWWENTSSNITSMRFFFSNGTGIGVGSRIEIWAKR